MRIFEQDVSQAKNYFQGTHRAVPPAETLRRYSPLLPKIGVTRIADITGLDKIGLPVYTSIRPNSRSLAASQGKGFDHDSAKASAMMEAIESWHAERAGGHCVYDNYHSLSEIARVVDPEKCQVGYGPAPSKLEPYYWTRGWDLMAQDWCYVPHELATLNMTAFAISMFTFALDSNGLSSGNHPLEAVVHGLCEVIERDSYTLWKRQTPDQVGATSLDLGTIDDNGCIKLIEMLERVGVGVVAWDMASDIGVPAYSVRIHDKSPASSWRPIPPAYGLGCHLSPQIALIRAITEAVQTRVTVIAGSRDDLGYDKYDKMTKGPAGMGIEDPRATPTPTRSFHHRKRMDTPSFEGDVEALLGALRTAHISEVVAVDMSQPTIGIPVVKMIVPGLEGMRESAGHFQRDNERSPS